MRLGDWLAAYLSARIGLSAGYERELRVTVSQWDGSQDVARIDAAAVNAWLRRLNSAGRAATTVNNRRRMLLTLLGFAADCGAVVPVRPRQVARAREVRSEPTAWTVEEISRLADVAGRWPRHGPLFRALVLVCYYTGERIGALMACRVEDFCGCSLRVRCRKDGRSRTYRLPEAAVSAIEAMPRRADPRLFAWLHGRRHFFRTFRRVVLGAGLEADRKVGLFHRLRRTSGSLVEANGGDGAKHLGHSRRVFEERYLSPRVCPSGSRPDLLPRV